MYNNYYKIKDMVNKVSNSEIGKVLGEKVKQTRKSRCLTIDQLSEQCDITEGHLRNIESGYRMPSVPVLIDICNALKISPQDVLQPFLDVKSEKIDKERLLEIISNMDEDRVEVLIGVLQAILRV